MRILKQFNGIIPLLLLLLCFAVAQPGWAQSFYTIVAECNPSIGGTIAAPSFAAAGDTVYITVTPSDEYIISYVSGRYGSNSTYLSVSKDETTGQYYFVMPTGNVQISASFYTQYNVTAECYPPEGGTISGYPASAYNNARVEYSVTPNEGYYLNFTGLEGSYYNYTNQPSSNGRFNFSMPSHDAKIIANFGTITAHNITSTSDPDQVGTIDVVPTAMPGDNVTVTITGTEDYAVSTARYTYENLGTDKSLSNTNIDYLNNKFTGKFTMPAADVNIHAKYLKLYTLHTVCSPADAGTIQINQSSAFNKPFYYGNRFTTDSYAYFKITPKSGYSVAKVIITYTNQNGEKVTQEKQYDPQYMYRNLFSCFGVTSDVTITAVFTPYTITSECVPADGGSISVPGTASSGDQVNFTIITDEQHSLKDVTITSINGNSVPFNLDAESGQGSFTMPAYPVHIVANLNSIHTINVNWEPLEAGEMMVMNNEELGGKEIQFAVMPHDGYILGSVTSTNSDFEYHFVEHVEEEYEGQTYSYDIYSFIMPNEDITLTAHFISANTRFSITAINETPERGTIDVAETALPSETVRVTIRGTENYACVSDSLQLYYYDENHEIKPISVASSDFDYDHNVYTVDFVMPIADVFVKATFKPISSVSTNCVPAEGGTLTIESEDIPIYGNKYLEGCPMRMTRTTNDGYGLVSVSYTTQNEAGEQITVEMSPYDLWSFDYFGSFAFTMQPADVTITATFGRIYTVTAICNPDEGGTIQGGTMQHGPTSQCAGGMEYMFYIQPNDGYDFDSSDISVTYVNPDNETVTIPVEYDNNGSFYHFIMPEANATIRVDFKPAHNLVIVNDPENGGWTNEVVVNGNSLNPDELSIGAGKQVNISFNSADGYLLQDVTLIMINETTSEEEVTHLTATDGYYTLTMPDADVTVKASYTAMPPLYLLGTANGDSTWNSSGVPLDIVNGQYTATVYFKGYSSDDNEADGWGYFLFSTASDDNWDAIKDNLLSAPSDKFPALRDGESSSVQQLHNEYHYDGTLSHRFMVPAGIYKIVVSPDLTTMSINEIKPTITFSPEMYYEPIGQLVLVSGLDWVLNTILKINPDEKDYVENITVNDAVGTWESNHFSSRFGLRAPGLATVTATNSVGYITASNTTQYYVFDLEYPPLQFIEGSNPIDYPNVSIRSGQPVTVGDELIGAWGAQNILWVKDQGQLSTKFLNAPEGTIDYLREVFKLQKRDWDQSNWVMLDFGALYPDWETNEETYLAMHEKIASYVDHRIDARTIRGTYIAPGSFFRQRNSTNEYTKGMHCILLSDFPVAIQQPVGESLGYPGYVEDPTEQAGKFYQDPSRYMYNHYTPVNFRGYIYKPSQLGSYPFMVNPFVYSAGSSALGDLATSDTRFFFMQPKDAEVAQVWAVWLGSMTFKDDYTGNTITRDVFETYRPGIDAQGISYNSYGIEGAFQVYSWQWNRLPATDTDQTPRYGKPEQGFEPNTPYLFHIAILHAYNTHMMPPPIPKAPRIDAGDGEVEMQADLGANAPIASMLQPNSIYRVFPLDMTRPDECVTGVDEAVIDRNDAAYEIVDITYYNVMGMASKRPFDGINIEVTTYSDGHKTSKKLLIPAR